MVMISSDLPESYLQCGEPEASLGSLLLGRHMESVGREYGARVGCASGLVHTVGGPEAKGNGYRGEFFELSTLAVNRWRQY